MNAFRDLLSVKSDAILLVICRRVPEEMTSVASDKEAYRKVNHQKGNVDESILCSSTFHECARAGTFFQIAYLG